MISRIRVRTVPGTASVLAGLVALISAAAVQAQEAAGLAAPRQPAELELLYHADLDGRFAQPDCRGVTEERPSYPRLLGVLAKARAAATSDRSAPVVLLGGNIAAPALLGRNLLEQGATGSDKIGRLLARAGYDAVALGHHDLALDPLRLQALVDAMTAHDLPVVVTNLACEDERTSLCERTRRQWLVRRKDTTVGIVATISPSVLSGLAAGSRAGMRLDDPLTAIRAATQTLRAQGASRVVVMVQGPRDRRGLDELDALQRALGNQPGAPDVILVGGLADDDGNRAIELLRRQDAPPAVGSGLGPAAFVRVSMVAGTLYSDRIPVVAPTPDAEAQALLAPEIAAYCREHEKPLSSAPVRGAFSRDDFITYVLEILRRRAGAEVALVNRALVKAAPFPITGQITRGQLHAALPYPAVIGVARITGATLATVLGPTLDNSKAVTVGLGRRGSDLVVNGRPVDKARSYRVATIAFVAAGGDGIVDESALPWHPLSGQPDLRDAIASFLRDETGRRDGDASIDPRTDFGLAPADRLLMVGLSDGGLDIADTRIDNGPGYGDPQLTRGKQRVWKAEWTGILQTRHPRHESDTRLNLKYAWTRSQPAGGVPSSTETADLITFNSVYNYRGLRRHPAVFRRDIPDPYGRVGVESELTRPAVTATQTRTYHHFELTSTAGLLFTLSPALKFRTGGGVRKELLTTTQPFGHWRPVVEAGGTLLPTALATVGPLPVRAEGFFEYTYVDPTDVREHQLRASGKLSVPLLPLLFVTVGLDVFAVQRRGQGWGASYDTTLGLRVHLDAARQWL